MPKNKNSQDASIQLDLSSTQLAIRLPTLMQLLQKQERIRINSACLRLAIMLALHPEPLAIAHYYATHLPRQLSFEPIRLQTLMQVWDIATAGRKLHSEMIALAAVVTAEKLNVVKLQKCSRLGLEEELKTNSVVLDKCAPMHKPVNPSCEHIATWGSFSVPEVVTRQPTETRAGNSFEFFAHPADKGHHDDFKSLLAQSMSRSVQSIN